MRLPFEKYKLLVTAPEVCEHLLHRPSEPDTVYYDTSKLTRSYQPLHKSYVDGFIFHLLLIEHEGEMDSDKLIKIELDKEMKNQKWPGQL